MLRIIQSTVSPYYESIEFNVNTATTDYDVDAQQTTFLAIVGPSGPVASWPRHVVIRTNQTISVKFNSTSDHAITIASTDSPFEYEGEVRNIFITNGSGNTAAIKILTTV